jgi:molecular chaperone DnaJ
MSLDVKLADALLGAEYEIETLDGKEKLTIPEGLQPGAILRVHGKGVHAGAFQTGDILIQTSIVIPKKLSKEAKKLVEELKKNL